MGGAGPRPFTAAGHELALEQEKLVLVVLSHARAPSATLVNGREAAASGGGGATEAQAKLVPL